MWSLAILSIRWLVIRQRDSCVLTDEGYFNVRIGGVASSLRNQMKWRFPKRWLDQYKIGDTIRLNESGSSTLLKEHEFTITGFVNSSEILSNTIKGVSSAGSGDLSGFAVVPQDAFDSEVYTDCQTSLSGFT